MNLVSFLKYYDLNDYYFINVKSINDNLIFEVSSDLNIPLMANGFRPSFDLNNNLCFIFINQKKVKDKLINEYPKSFKYENDILIINFSNGIYYINSCDIEVKKVLK